MHPQSITSPFITRDCEQCGTLFQARRWAVARGEGRFCGLVCMARWRETQRAAVRPVTTCAACGQPFKLHRHGSAPLGRYCSRACSARAQAADAEALRPARFWAQVDKNGPLPERCPELGPCWLWLGSLTRDGYGRFHTTRNRYTRAHCWSYTHCIGPIPDPLTIDHLCRRRACVNPGHLRLLTSVENCMAGDCIPALNARKIECLHGHPFSPENTYIRPKTGHRACKTCARLKLQRRRARQRQGGENRVA